MNLSNHVLAHPLNLKRNAIAVRVSALWPQPWLLTADPENYANYTVLTVNSSTQKLQVKYRGNEFKIVFMHRATASENSVVLNGIHFLVLPKQ